MTGTPLEPDAHDESTVLRVEDASLPGVACRPRTDVESLPGMGGPPRADVESLPGDGGPPRADVESLPGDGGPPRADVESLPGDGAPPRADVESLPGVAGRLRVEVASLPDGRSIRFFSRTVPADSQEAPGIDEPEDPHLGGETRAAHGASAPKFGSSVDSGVSGSARSSRRRDRRHGAPRADRVHE